MTTDKTHAVRAVVTMFAAGMVVLTTAVAQMATVASQAGGDTIVGPDNWVPVTYRYELFEDDAPVAAYTEYRFSDGSLRKDRDDGRESSILNVTADRYFEFPGPGGMWLSHPMRPQFAGGKPYLRLQRSTVTPVWISDPRLQAFTAVGMPVSFYEFRAGTERQVATVFCPELNMLIVWERRPRGTKTLERRLTSVVMGEPRAALLPDAHAPIDIRDRPAGPGRVSWE